jgi:hypothetical protein
MAKKKANNQNSTKELSQGSKKEKLEKSKQTQTRIRDCVKFVQKYNDYAIVILNLEMVFLNHLGGSSEAPFLQEAIMFLYLNFLGLKQIIL